MVGKAATSLTQLSRKSCWQTLQAQGLCKLLLPLPLLPVRLARALGRAFESTLPTVSTHGRYREAGTEHCHCLPGSSLHSLCGANGNRNGSQSLQNLRTFDNPPQETLAAPQGRRQGKEVLCWRTGGGMFIFRAAPCPLIIPISETGSGRSLSLRK